MPTSGTSTNDRWLAVRDLFDAALALEPVAREAFLRAAAADDTIRDAARRLVRLHEDLTASGDALGGEAVADALDDLLRTREFARGEAVGGFRIERLLGEGGMGRVYLATRPVGGSTQRVALKIVPFAVHDRRRVERLRHERAILATLDHPHIARLIDAGELPDERPYFAMEYVDGVAIARHCDDHALDLPARLALFADACDAVAYAHRQLVLHRDLKPSNILVDAGGRVRLVDFGIAKSLDGAAGGDATLDGGFFSLHCAAPEQVLGRATSVATDVYGLGCVLYELLAGRPPFRFSDVPREAIVEIVAHRPAPPPSGAARDEDAAARQRRLPDGKALAAALRGDLDAIVANALRKDPNDRYRSVDELSADVRNVLAFRPIASRTAEWRHRLACFVRRNRVAAVVAAALGAAVIVASTASFVQYRRAVAALATAQVQRDHARRVTHFLVESFEAADPVRARGRDLRAEELLASAVASLDRNAATQDPVLRATIAQTLAHLFFTLDRLPESRHQAQIARAAFDRVRDAPATLAASQGLTDAEAAFVQTRYGDAIAAANAALARLGDDAEDGDLVYGLHLIRNRATAAAGRYREAAALYRETEATLARRGDVGIDRLDRLRQLHASLLSDNDRNAEARALLDALLAEQRARGGADDPMLTETLRLLSHALLRMSAAPETRSQYHRLANAYSEEALARHRAMYGDDNALGAHLLLNRATLLAIAGDFDAALAAYRRAIDVGTQRIGERSAFLVLLYTRLSHLYRDRLGDDAGAERAARLALAASPPEGAVSRAAASMILANLLAQQERRFEAEYHVDEALSLLSPEHLERAYLDVQLAYLRFRQYRFDDAAGLLTPYAIREVHAAGPTGANRDRHAQLVEMAAFFRFDVVPRAHAP